MIKFYVEENLDQKAGAMYLKAYLLARKKSKKTSLTDIFGWMKPEHKRKGTKESATKIIRKAFKKK